MTANRQSLRRALDAVNHLTDPAPPWIEILQSARDLVGADSGSLIVFDSNRALLNFTTVGLSDQCVADYNTHYFNCDILERGSSFASAGTWLDTAEMFGSKRLQCTEFFADFMVKHNQAQLISLIVESNAALHATIGFQRSSVDDRAKERLESGDVAGYFRLFREKLAERQRALFLGLQAMENAFSALGEALLLLSGDGFITNMSPLANEYVGNGSGWTTRNGRLAHADQATQKLLERLCSATARDGQPRTLAAQAGWGEIIVSDIAIAPDSLSLLGGKMLMARMLHRSAFSKPDIDQLAAVFEITPAEASILAGLAGGHSVEEIASLRKASVLTVRKQVAALMKKMNCSRQSELVRLASLL